MRIKLVKIFIMIVVIIGMVFALSYQKNITILSGSENKNIDSSAITFAVFGETGKVVGWNYAADLTDSIFIVDYHPNIGAANIISLPRDLYVNLDGESFKLNEAVKRNKVGAFLNKLPEITGMTTDQYIILNIDLLKSVVDDLDGIDINLKSDAVDWVSGYTIKAGQNHLDGDQVVWLARNRYAPEGDFFREKNQYEVIKAIADKFKSLNPIEKAAFVFKITPEIAKLKTNLDFQQLLPAMESFGGIRFNDIVLDFQTGLLESSTTTIGTSSAYILVPKSGADNYVDVKTYIQSKIEK